MSSKIAIVGLAGRFPRARDVRELWRNLCGGVEGVRELSFDELARAGVEPELARDPRYVRASADVDGIELFEPEFFGLNPREAQATDPQQRLLLELAWEALEDSGTDPARFDGALGVFVGASRNDYLARVLARDELVAALGAYAIEIANSRDFLATRIAYALDLRGPCLTIQTACSTSLVAVHVACQSLLAGECDLALAGGASIRLPQGVGYAHVAGGVASPDGHCRAFDACAAGTVAGNGGGLVALRRLDDALRDGDPIRAVILGTAVNNDGAAKVGFTAPSVDGQTAVIEEALAIAGVAPATIGYVEAHGTGTPLGDPIEVAALKRAFGERGRCALASIKSSLGHLDAAAGVAGLIKATLALERGAIPPSLHFERANPALGLDASPFFVPSELRAWKRGAEARRAGVSSFGIGGTNAHAVLEESPSRAASSRDGGPRLIALSARSDGALADVERALEARMREEPELELVEVAWTLQSGRREFAHRRAFVARDREHALELLDRGGPSVVAGEREVAFLFPGQGAQHARMGCELARALPAFAAELERCARVLEPELGLDVREVLAAQDDARLDETWLTQPALFAVELALARSWIALGVAPAAMLGHSIGEWVAATLAGVFEPDDALRLVAARGRLIHAQPRGSMLAVALPAGELVERLPATLSIASINGPRACVVAGASDAIAQFARELEHSGVAARELRTSHAFHSPLVAGAVEPFRELVARVRRSPPRIPFLSNVTGAWITRDQALDASYWANHLLAPVRLFDGLTELARRGASTAIECGPGRTFAALGADAALRLDVVRSMPTSRDARGEHDHWLAAVGELWARGHAIDWRALHAAPQVRVSLPTYPFERRRCWVDAEIEPARPARSTVHAPAFVAASDAERTLADIWRSVLGRQPTSLDDDFFELGGSSLLAIQVIAAVRERLGVELAARDLLEAPTLRALLARVTTGGSRSTITELRPGTREHAWFLVHGIDGDVASFGPLARALPTRSSVFALRAPGIERGETPCGSVDELAARHFAAVRELFDETCTLVGHSFGGVVALEIARRLEDAGRKVELVVLLDSRAPSRDACDPAALESATRRAFAALSPAAIDARVATVAAHTRALSQHRVRPCRARALLVIARDEPDAALAASAWRELALPGMEISECSGDHASLLAQVRVAALAARLSDKLLPRVPQSGVR